MRVFDERSGECLIFTFKEGLLSAVAHDLQLRVGRFRVEVAEESASVTAEFDPSSLSVVCAMKQGRPAPGALSPSDVRTIEKNIRDEVLESRKHASIRFVSTRATSERVEGRLSLHGRDREIALAVESSDAAKRCEVTLHQPDFGIRPYSAMLGALKVNPDVKIVITLAWSSP